MPDSQRLRDMIELDVFLFQGVPERPNPVYGRDSFASVQSRTSREIVEGTPDVVARAAKGQVVQVVTVNLVTGELSFGEFMPRDGGSNG